MGRAVESVDIICGPIIHPVAPCNTCIDKLRNECLLVNAVLTDSPVTYAMLPGKVKPAYSQSCVNGQCMMQSDDLNPYPGQQLICELNNVYISIMKELSTTC